MLLSLFDTNVSFQDPKLVESKLFEINWPQILKVKIVYKYAHTTG